MIFRSVVALPDLHTPEHADPIAGNLIKAKFTLDRNSQTAIPADIDPFKDVIGYSGAY